MGLVQTVPEKKYENWYHWMFLGTRSGGWGIKDIGRGFILSTFL